MVGCRIGAVSHKNLSYADDMVLIAPTASALQLLIDECQQYAEEHDIVYNTSKTECMVIPPRNARISYAKAAKLNGCTLKFVEFHISGTYYHK